jgi:hypothetical protein
MIWNVYRLEDDKPCARYWFCRYASAEALAMKRFGSEVMVLGVVADARRRRAEKDFSDSVVLPSKGGPFTS